MHPHKHLHISEAAVDSDLCLDVPAYGAEHQGGRDHATVLVLDDGKVIDKSLGFLEFIEGGTY